MGKLKLHLVTLLSILVISVLSIANVAPAQAANLGIKSKSFHIPNCLQPPPNLNLKTVSNIELFSYGFPPRPTDPKGIAAWTDLIKKSKHRDCNGEMSTNTIHNHPVTKSSGLQSLISIDNPTSYQAGYYSYSYSLGNFGRHAFHSISADFTIPCFDSSIPAEASAWSGLDDGGSRSLIQSGVEFNGANVDQINGGPPLALWVQFYDGNDLANNPTQFDTDHFPVCNDSISTYSDYYLYNFGNGDQSVFYSYVRDNTQNFYFQQWKVFGLYDPRYDNMGTRALWLTERSCQESSDHSHCVNNPYNNTPLLPLANFHNITFTNTNVSLGGNNKNVGQVVTDLLQMQNKDNVIMAYPGGISPDGTTFRVYWYHK